MKYLATFSNFALFLKMASMLVPREIGEYKIETEMALGTGTDSTVYLAIHIPSQTKVAAKVIYIINNSQKRERALSEAYLLRQLSKHEFIINFFEFLENSSLVILFLEYAPHGDLGTYVHRHGRLEEEVAKRFFVQLVLALEHCHTNNIAHHDLKLENILIGIDHNLRLIDFGLSKRFGKDLVISEPAGSPLYMSPEIFSNEKHDQQTDIWSLGICLYYMTTDIFPFVADSYSDLQEKVLFDEVAFPNKMSLSENLQDLIKSMLHKDPKQRASLALIRKHPWLRKSYNAFRQSHNYFYYPSDSSSDSKENSKFPPR